MFIFGKDLIGNDYIFMREKSDENNRHIFQEWVKKNVIYQGLLFDQRLCLVKSIDCDQSKCLV